MIPFLRSSIGPWVALCFVTQLITGCSRSESPSPAASAAAPAVVTVAPPESIPFTPTETRHVFFDRTVLDCAWREGGENGDELILRIEANAFLRHMVRVLVGTMLEVGRGVRDVDAYVALLDGAARSQAGPTAPPHALTLVAVRYPQ